MCETVGSRKLRIAKNDITVYKKFGYRNKAYYGAVFGTRNGRSYLKDYLTPVKIGIRSSYGEYKTNTGYYSYGLKRPACGDERVVEFIIPKGTKYIKSIYNDVYVSEILKFVKVGE